MASFFLPRSFQQPKNSVLNSREFGMWNPHQRKTAVHAHTRLKSIPLILKRTSRSNQRWYQYLSGFKAFAKKSMFLPRWAGAKLQQEPEAPSSRITVQLEDPDCCRSHRAPGLSAKQPGNIWILALSFSAYGNTFVSAPPVMLKATRVALLLLQ